MPMSYTNPDTLPAPFGRYSHVASARGRLVGIAGQVSATSDGTIVGIDDCAAQVVQVLENLRLALEAAELQPGDLLQTTTYLTDADLIPAFMAARTEVFAQMFPDGSYPPNTLLVISRLVEPELLVEVSALAVAPD